MNSLTPLAAALAADEEPPTRAEVKHAVIKAAQGVLIDPTDATALLDLDEYLLPNGTINHKGITYDVAKLVKQKPYLKTKITLPK